jgi:hypothetical protein
MTTTISSLFGIFVTATYVYMAFISRSMNKNRFTLRIILGLISMLFGFLFGQFQPFNKSNGVYYISGLAPLIYLLWYEIFRRILKPWIGAFPYAPHWDKIGESVKGVGYQKNRFVTSKDRIFGLLMFFVPFLTLIILIMIFEN